MTTRVPWRRWTDPAPMRGLVISRCAITENRGELRALRVRGPETHAPAVPHTPCANAASVACLSCVLP